MGGIIGFAIGLVIGAGAGVIITAVLVAARDAAEYERKEAGMPCDGCVHDSEAWDSEACDGCAPGHSRKERDGNAD